MKVPTFTIRNIVTGERRVVDQAKYHSDFVTGGNRFRSVALGGSWEIVNESNAGGDAGYQKSKENLNFIVGIDMKRERDRVGRR